MSNKYSEDVEKCNLHKIWKDKRKEAYLYEKLEADKVRCKLCPRECLINSNGVGFCKVRKNIDGKLYAQSYEKATHITIEQIETEAVFHYMPGSKILSLGNFGCNLNCDYCQNWLYSQFEYTSEDKIHEYTADEIIKMALDNDIKILSWTYNDPAVWFEFVIDVAKKAKEHGLINLFKSAFFLSKEAVEQLCEVIDIFAISIKAIDQDYYKQFTKAWLQPVLDNAQLVYERGKHCEVSNLVVTDLTNNKKEYDKMIGFMKDNLSSEVPLHFTRFHPDYKFTHVEKTPVEDVMEARNRALSSGLKYAYVGNIFESEGLNTYCPQCKNVLIERYGLHAYVTDNIDNAGKCLCCNYQTNIQGINDNIRQN